MILLRDSLQAQYRSFCGTVVEVYGKFTTVELGLPHVHKIVP